jgi:hypothetical protein
MPENVVLSRLLIMEWFWFMERTFAGFLIVLRYDPYQRLFDRSGVWNMTIAVLAEVGMIEVTNTDAVGVISVHCFLPFLSSATSILAISTDASMISFFSVYSELFPTPMLTQYAHVMSLAISYRRCSQSGSCWSRILRLMDCIASIVRCSITVIFVDYWFDL